MGDDADLAFRYRGEIPFGDRYFENQLRDSRPPQGGTT